MSRFEKDKIIFQLAAQTTANKAVVVKYWLDYNAICSEFEG